ncbi:MAG: hypothetical protein NVS3B19_09850 [Ginsengibacter sp.]
MPLLEKQLVVKKSLLPKAGNGLFTKKFISKGTRIVEYKGIVSSWKDADHEDGLNAYIYFINRNLVINASKDKKALARYANDAKGIAKLKGLSNNCQYVLDKKKVYIEAIKDIEANSEILVAYGKDYWDVIKKNMREANDKERARQVA